MPSRTGSSPQTPAGKDAEKKNPRKAQDVNVALRRAYDSAVDESIPQSMLDLLSKLN
ncbi:NepR family anti-sigma factor [Sphingopyxis panaciterrae]